MKNETKELEALENAKLRTYTIDTFKRYWTYEDDYEFKKARVVNATYIVVYSVWHKRLLARIFYFEEYMKYKKITRKLFEVQRQLAGMEHKITKRLYNSTFVGFKVWTGIDRCGWQTCKAVNYQLCKIYDSWNGKTFIGFDQYNDPIPYLKKSIHKYCAYEQFPDDRKGHNKMFDYLIKYENHPQLEMLVKTGLTFLIDDLGCIKWSKKGWDMLGITKQELPYLVSGIKLRAYRKIRAICLKHKLSIKEAQLASELYIYIHNKYNRSKLEVSVRLIKYLTEHNVRINDYDDLIYTKDNIGLPDEKRYIYPENFMAMHDFLHKRVEIKKSQEIAAKMKKRKKELMKYSIEKNGILIKPLLSQDDLINEGKALHHCVGMYAERVARGETAIFTIRKVSDAEKPIATLELKDKRIMQVRAEHNSVPPEEIQVFVRNWEKQYKLTGY